MRKLSFEENLRHRLRKLPKQLHLRDDKSSHVEGWLFLSLGVAAGVAAGVLIAQRYGGLSAVSSRLRTRFGKETERDVYAGEREYDEDDYNATADLEDLSSMEILEERVLEAYRNDPTLSERAVDIGAIDDGIIELTGWVHSADEATHAVTVARGTPGVTTVVNRLAVRDDDDRYDGFAERYQAGDDSLTEGRWEGQQTGMGRRRQGSSADPERHEDPKAMLEDRWLSEPNAEKNAAGDVGDVGVRAPKAD